MEEKSGQKRKIIIMAAVAFAVVAVFLALMLGDMGEKVSLSDGVIIYDSQGKELAAVKIENERIETTLINEDAGEYVALVIDEALEEYGRITDSEDAESEFFSVAKAINTNFSSDMLKKIKEGYLSSGINTDASFASVITDIQGRVLAVYGKGEDEDTLYSDKKTYAGSAIKPLSVYALAIQDGKAHWSSMIEDSPVKKVVSESGYETDWPSNATGIYTNEDMLLCDAVYKSTNTVAVKVLQKLPAEKSLKFLQKFLGMDLEYEQMVAETEGADEILGNIALGYLYNGVSPLDMAGYYQIFANAGNYTEPYTVVSIEGAEGEIYVAEPRSSRVISSAAASVMTQLLKGVLYPGGTASAASLENTEVAGKSGTSDEYADNWFVGFTPEYVCSVWHSSDGDRTNKASATFALIMKDVPVETERFNTEKGVMLKFFCRKTGLLQGKGCTDVSSGYYLESRLPGRCNSCGK